jgi:hypothetical protein
MSTDKIAAPVIDERAQFEASVSEHFNLSLRRSKSTTNNGMYFGMYLDDMVDRFWTIWQERAKIAQAQVAPLDAALQDLALCDGSYANVRDAVVLAARVRNISATALRADIPGALIVTGDAKSEEPS